MLKLSPDDRKQLQQGRIQVLWEALPKRKKGVEAP
jgi:hypothetical protein